MEWSDLRVFVAVSQSGSLRAAAEVLGMSHATVSRRLTALEHAMGVKLLRRVGSRYEITSDGTRLAEVGSLIESQLNDVQLGMMGRDRRLEGCIQLTLSDLFVGLVGTFLTRFQQKHPAITFDLRVGVEQLNLNQREADIALRVTSNPPETLVGRRVCSLGVSAYHLRSLESDYEGALASERWIGWSVDMSRRIPSLRWFHQHVPSERVVARVSTPGSMLGLIESGVGIGLLPCFIGDRRPDLQRLQGMALQTAGDVWVLMHRELRDSARYFHFVRGFADYLRELSPLLSGTEFDAASNNHSAANPEKQVGE